MNANPTQETGENVGTQYAALCYRRTDRGKTEILLITSRDTGRWVIPKGWPIKGLDAPQAAEQEAFEEAGVKGVVSERCLGLFSYAKSLGPKEDKPVVVAVFPLRVRKLIADFPEKSERRLRWFTPRRAASQVNEPELAALIRSFDPGIVTPKGAASS